MACGAKVERVPSIVKTPTLGSPAALQSTLAQLPATSLVELCQRLRVQLIQQRLPLICAACRPHIMRAYNMEVNLTQMVRGLCQACRGLFMTSDMQRVCLKPILAGMGQLSSPMKVKASSSPSIRKVILKMALQEAKQSGKITRKAALKSDRPIFEAMTEAGMDWCRYCGTTNGVNWRPGPWGQRTLCNKHGCAYHGYGFSKGLPRLDLSAYEQESLSDRRRPIVQETCTVCQQNLPGKQGHLFQCFGCPRAYHAECLPAFAVAQGDERDSGWFCSPECPQNYTLRAVITSPVKTQRTLSEPLPTLGKRRFAKQFDLMGCPPTPPPTPQTVTKKRRMTSDLMSEVMVCFDPDVVVKRNIPDRTTVFTPLYQSIPLPIAQSLIKLTNEECLDDKDLLERHKRYEEVEKTMRLCRPEVLKTLYSSKSGEDSLVSTPVRNRRSKSKGESRSSKLIP
jgi:hypothetical protein